MTNRNRFLIEVADDSGQLLTTLKIVGDQDTIELMALSANKANDGPVSRTYTVFYDD